MKYSDNKNQVLTIPNILSFVRLGLIPLMVWLYCGKEAYLPAGIVLIISGLTDIIDGFVARHFNMTSELGKVLDPIADKFTQGAMLLCLILRFPLMLLPFVMIIIKEMFMTVSGYMIIKKSGKVLSAQWHGKVATVCLFVMMMLHIFWVDITQTVSDIAIVASSLTVALSFVLYAVRNIKELSGK